MALHVVVTAGGELPGELRHLADSNIKALLPVGGATLLGSALVAAGGLAGLGRIVVVGPEELDGHLPAGVGHAPPGADLADNLHRGMQAVAAADDDELLLLSPDLPFVTAAALEQLAGGARGGCELAVPLVPAAAFRALYPGSPNTFLTLEGREVTMGSAFWITGRMLRTNIPLIRDFARMRKSPLKLAALLGPAVALGLLTRRLRLAALERRASQLTGGAVRAVEVTDATVAYDIDNRANYEYAMQHLRHSSTAL